MGVLESLLRTVSRRGEHPNTKPLTLDPKPETLGEQVSGELLPV